jgi:signal transduction histidine kinase
VTAILVDITAQKRAEASLSGEIHMKNQFIASVSHELRTPLTAVVGLIEELTDSTIEFDDDERQELLEITAKQARDVAGIVEDLLVAARADRGELTIVTEAFEVGELLRSTVPTYGNTGRIEAPDGLKAIGDPGRVRQILRNLLTNAARYGGDSQRVVANNTGRTIKIEVRDSGPPIPEVERMRMFQPYERAHERPGRPESVGLGLAVSRDLARMMDGDLSYRHDGSESAFILELPTA